MNVLNRLTSRQVVYLCVGFLLLLALVGLLLFALSGYSRQETFEPGRSSPQLESRGSLQFPNTPAGNALSAHIQNVVATGPGADARYQASLEGLRQHLPEVVTILAETYQATDKTLYPTRWALVQTLANLRAEAAVDPLIQIAREPVPPPRGGDNDGLDPYEEESLIRMVAIQGLGYLVGANDAAAQTLGELTKHKIIAVSEEAVRSLAEAIRGLRNGVPPMSTADLERRVELLTRFLPPNHDLTFDPSKIQPVPPADANPALQPLKGRSSSAAPQRKNPQ
ncbi:MAG: HEAT repeat domain-containing protein [Blastocatellia bacterium]